VSAPVSDPHGASHAPFFSRRIVLVLAVPLALAALACLALEPSARALLAPLAGPWAGHLYGHDECTLASVAPRLSLASAGAVLAGILALTRLRGVARGGALAFTGLALALWCALACLSVLNTRS
jgi:hypothetical protein